VPIIEHEKGIYKVVIKCAPDVKRETTDADRYAECEAVKRRLGVLRVSLFVYMAEIAILSKTNLYRELVTCYPCEPWI
jgi:hypothetical protein